MRVNQKRTSTEARIIRKDIKDNKELLRWWHGAYWDSIYYLGGYHWTSIYKTELLFNDEISVEFADRLIEDIDILRMEII